MQCGLNYSITRPGLPFTRVAMSVWKTICLLHRDLHKVCLDPYALELASGNYLLQQDNMVDCPVAPVDCSIGNISRDQSRRILGLPIGKKLLDRQAFFQRILLRVLLSCLGRCPTMMVPFQFFWQVN